jgi:hypothetical protein
MRTTVTSSHWRRNVAAVLARRLVAELAGDSSHARAREKPGRHRGARG